MLTIEPEPVLVRINVYSVHQMGLTHLIPKRCKSGPNEEFPHPTTNSRSLTVIYL